MKPAVCAAVLEAMERHGNPSSSHRYGRIARRYIEEARASVAALVGVKPAQVIFTSGGTEANAMFFYGMGNVSCATSSIEHDAVLAVTPQATRIPVTSDGVIDMDAATIALAALPKGSVVSLMFVNNETGVIQPIATMAALAKKCGHFLHSDAVQAVGRLPIDFADLGLNAMTLSAHKIGGPQGIGALIVDPKLVLNPLLKGGGQEMNRRAGTENVAGIVGFGVAAQLAVDDLRDMPNRAALRDNLQQSISSIGGADVTVLGAGAPRVANTLCVSMRNTPSETQVMAMDLAGVAVSAGSACSSGKVKASHVAKAMGFGQDVAGSTMRISLGWQTTAADLDRCLDAWRNLYQRTRQSNISNAA
jgi:cysteine desulfurase